MNKDSYNRSQDSIEQKHILKAKHAPRQCYYPGCTSTAISSHALQEKGVLSVIARKGKFRQLSQPTPFRKEGFYSVGVKETDMLTFYGFCNPHDESIFAEIENGKSDFLSYRHRALISYRGLLNDLFKAEVVVDYHNRLMNDTEYCEDRKKAIASGLQARKVLTVKDLMFYKKTLEQEIFNAEINYFSFHRFVLPKIDIATCTIYGAAFYHSLSPEYIASLDISDPSYKPISRPIFVNLIPQNNDLILILGHAPLVQSIEGVSVSEIGGLSNDKILKLLSIILLRNGTWGISENLYQKWNTTGKINQYMTLRHQWFRKSINLSNNPSATDNSSVFQNISVPDSYNLFDSI